MGKITSLIARAKESPLEVLTVIAADAEVHVKKLEAEDGQLSPKSYVDASAAVEGASTQEAKQLLDVLGNAENAPLASSFRRLCTAIRQWPKTGLLRKVKIGVYIDGDADGVLGRLRITHQSLFLAAAMTVAGKYPESFGSQTVTPEERQATFAKAVSQRDELLKQLADTWTREDVELLPVDDQLRKGGYCRLGIKFTGNAVCVGPDIAAHLVAWELSRRDTKAAA